MVRAIPFISTIATGLLSLCLACAIAAQALDTWWKVESTTTTKYTFGLYRICVSSPVSKCYRPNEKSFMEDNRGTAASKVEVIKGGIPIL